MGRSTFIYQCWSGDDMAQSDTWYPTLKLARDHARVCWCVPASAIRFCADGYWDGDAREDSEIAGYDVHMAKHRIMLTAVGVCDALTFWPNR